jgi:hypothetical protein
MSATVRLVGRQVWVDAVEKVGRKSRVRNNRIKKRRHSNQRCASGWFFESPHPQNLFSTLSAITGHPAPFKRPGELLASP